MLNDTVPIIDALEDLLDKERVAILRGALQDMERLAVEKERVLESGIVSVPDQGTLDRLRGKAARNQQLLTATIRGVRAVTARLDVLRNGPVEMNTYNRKGHRLILGARNKGALHHRA